MCIDTYQVVRETWTDDGTDLQFVAVEIDDLSWNDAVEAARDLALTLAPDESVSIEAVSDTGVVTWQERYCYGQVR